MADSPIRVKCTNDECEHDYHGLGAILDVSKAPSPDDIKAAMEEVHTEATAPADIDLANLDSPIKDQGQLGSCTGHGGVAVLEHEAARVGAKVDDLSELYMYYRNRQASGLSTSQDSGAYPDAAAKVAKQYGVCLESLSPYIVSNFAKAPTAQMDQDAANHKAVNTAEISANDLGTIWSFIQNKQGPYICFYVYQSFESVGASGKVPMPNSSEQVLGGHCIKISGWKNDSSAPGGLGYFKCKNSWGTAHGAQGYYYLPTAYFTSGIVDGVFAMTIAGSVPPDPTPSDDWKSEVTGIAEEVQRLITSAQSTGWSSADVRSELGSIKDYMNQTKELVPDDFASSADIDGICDECSRLITNAQNTGWSSANVRSQLGSIKDYMDQVKDMVGADNPPPNPPPSTDDEAWGDFLSGAAGVTAPTKWMPGNGEDIFVPRNTIVKAPIAGKMTYQEVQEIPGYYGGEMVITNPDGRTVRFRHVQSTVGASGNVTLGQPVAKVYDRAMDIIFWPPSWPYRAPDGYQHCDVSLASSPQGIDPTGGAGGNVNSYKHIFQEKGGVKNITVHTEMRTPGPGDSGR